MTPNEPLLTVDEVAALVRLDGETVRRWARDELVPAVKLPGGHWRFQRAVVEAIMRGETPVSAA